MASDIIETRSPTRKPSRGPLVARTATVLLGLYFVAGGIIKLQGPEMLVTAFADWGYPGWFLYAVGTIELVGGILVIVPAATAFGGFVLAGLMAGAALTHVTYAEWSMIPLPFALAVATTAVAWHYAPPRFKARLRDLDSARPSSQ